MQTSPWFRRPDAGLRPCPNISALVLRGILVYSDRNCGYDPQKQKQLTPLNQQIEAL